MTCIASAAALVIAVALPAGIATAQSKSLTVKELAAQGETQFRLQNYAAALVPLRQAADQGDARGQYWLGIMYSGGLGVEKNCDTAIEWLRKAANQRLPLAETGLGMAHYQGICVRRDHTTAAMWLQRAANQGFAAAQAQLGAMYLRGEGVREDHKAAFIWTKKALDREYAPDDPDAATFAPAKARTQLLLGLMYEGGLGVPKDIALARSWYQKSAEGGNDTAKARLAALPESAVSTGGMINLMCQGDRGRILVSIDPSLKKVTLQGGGTLEYKDDRAQYVSITTDAIEFGCRTMKDEAQLAGEMANNLFTNGPKTDLSKSMACLARNSIDRTTWVWRAASSGTLTGNRVEVAECSLLPAK